MTFLQPHLVQEPCVSSTFRSRRRCSAERSGRSNDYLVSGSNDVWVPQLVRCFGEPLGRSTNVTQKIHHFSFMGSTGTQYTFSSIFGLSRFYKWLQRTQDKSRDTSQHVKCLLIKWHNWANSWFPTSTPGSMLHAQYT